MRRTLFFLCCALASPALAAGFAIPEQSARAVGLAGAGTAASEGASALYYGPGSLAFEDGISAELSGTVISPSFQYRAPGAPAVQAEVAPALFVLPTLFASAPVAEGWFAGVGLFSHFGLGVTWPSSFAGRHEALRSNLTTLTVNPTAAYRLNETFGVAVGVDLVRATLELEQQLDLLEADGALRLGGGTWGIGANAGVTGQWLNEKLRVALSYRSLVPLRFSGRADFQVPAEFEGTLRDQNVSTTLTLPHVLSLGARHRFGRVSATGDLTYTTWSLLDALPLDFADDALDQSLPRAWVNTLSVRAGVELALTEPLTLRVGAGWDPTPSPSTTLSPSLPDGDRVLGGAGVGYALGNFYANAGVLYVHVLPRDSAAPAFPASYAGRAIVGSLSLGFRQ